ncbi:MAG: hypothetical protein HC889_12160 [Synechococcaceae cyanobacterium SM1_2_3]|nr:hypothetical protein [Synechococcaceae cyanobacterium SM1_2_3]
MLSQDFKEFVELLNRHEAEYLIVGGYAVGIHGYPRYTGDLDVWINPTMENAQKMIKVLNDFGFSSFGLAEADFIKPGNVIQMGYPPFRIDVLTKIDGVEFDDCYPYRISIRHDQILLNVIGINELKKNKKVAGRPKDLDDLINLDGI